MSDILPVHDIMVVTKHADKLNGECYDTAKLSSKSIRDLLIFSKIWPDERN